LDSKNQILVGEQFDPRDGKGLPERLVCRIYTDTGKGSGFAFQSVRGGKYIITNKHVIQSPFSTASRYAACFEHNQHNLQGSKLIKDADTVWHVCNTNVHALEIVNFLNPSSFIDQKDPITNKFYSIDDDIVALRFKEECVCGRSQPSPSLNEVLVIPTVPETIPVTLLGFPGNSEEKSRVLSLADDVNDIDFKAALKAIPKNVLHYSEGEILAKSIISCISNSSVAGMSGSPLLFKDVDGWKITGILLGGPAVPGHRELIKILEDHENLKYNECENQINTFTSDNPSLQRVANDLMLDFRTNNFKRTLINFYLRLINEEYLILTRQGSGLSKTKLNHNLVFDCSTFTQNLP
jgi:hypothetical protein